MDNNWYHKRKWYEFNFYHDLQEDLNKNKKILESGGIYIDAQPARHTWAI